MGIEKHIDPDVAWRYVRLQEKRMDAERRLALCDPGSFAARVWERRLVQLRSDESRMRAKLYD